MDVILLAVVLQILGGFDNVDMFGDVSQFVVFILNLVLLYLAYKPLFVKNSANSSLSCLVVLD